jgi:hypothetical protein
MLDQLMSARPLLSKAQTAEVERRLARLRKNWARRLNVDRRESQVAQEEAAMEWPLVMDRR